jgi:hypothetical protein
LPAAALAGALLFSTPATAQDASGDIAERIESTFRLVLGNSEELAIPLTRRALARRASEDDSPDGVAPLAYGSVETDVVAPEETGAITPAGETVEEGSAADMEELARLPRPRPVQADDPDADPAAEDLATADPATENPATGDSTTADIATAEAVGGPLDLVAAAAEPEVSQEFAASELAHEAVADAPPPVPSAAATSPSASAPGEIAVAAAAPVAPAEPPLELIASGSCLSPAEVSDKDGDFERNAEILSGSIFCIAEEKFKERRRHWTIATIKTSRPGPLFAVMHDDEDQSFDSAVAALKTYGGTLVAVDTGGKRNQDGIDPNRNFSADGIGCKKLGKDATPKYTEFFQKLFDPARPIIALHNNTGARISTGGLGHVSMDDVPKDMEKEPSDNPDAPLTGDQTLVLMTSPVPVTTTVRSAADELNAKGINAIVEPVSEGKGDCSLSNYASLSGHPNYFNVTVGKDEGEKQQKLIDAILAPPTETVATQ